MDREIDRAVQAMLDREAPAGLRARVLSRIERRPRTRRAGWALVPLAAAGIVVLAVVLRPSPARSPLPSIPVARVNDVALPDEVVPVRETAKPEPVPAQRVPLRRRPQAEGVVAAATLSPGMVVSTPIASLTPMEAIAFTPITTDRIAPSAISVPTLPPIADVQIGPLTPPDGR